jgi:cysteine/glycine-rich protein
VYVTEKITADGTVYHKACFKCLHCNGTLTLSNFAAMNGKTYCKPHFKQLFKMEGKYNFAGKEGAAPAGEETPAESS